MTTSSTHQHPAQTTRRRITSRSGMSLLAAVAVAACVAATPSAAVAAASPTDSPSVLHVGQIARQDVPVLPDSEPDTLVEPDVAVSPIDPRVAVAGAHDGRYPDGGAVGIEVASTQDGGATWRHYPLPKLTKATGGSATWERASDPVVAFGPDGTAYMSTLLFNTGCDSAVAVSRSTDGGRSFGAPVLAHRSSTCDVSDDKNTIVVDTGVHSPHRGRIYQFWTPFLADIFGHPQGSPQALVYSDDHGRTWSQPVAVSRPHANSQNSQPMIQPDGTLVDAFLDYGPDAADEGSEAAEARKGDLSAIPQSSSASATTRAGADAFKPVFTTVKSTDGGRTWHPGGAITTDLGGPSDFRCCLMSATADAVTGTLYASWNAANAKQVRLSSSTDGVHWSTPVVVNRPTATMLGINSDVAAYDGTVSVSFGLTNADASHGRFGQQFVATSSDGGRTFSVPTAVGPRINYAYAAFARGIFPGDYIGTAMTKGRLYAVWCVSSKPATAGATYHQVVYGAVFDTHLAT